MQNYYLYLARCKDNSIYTGISSNPLQRIKIHNLGLGPNFTKIRRPIKLIYLEKFPDLKSAMKREKQIKGWRREKKENLILYGHPNGPINNINK